MKSSSASAGAAAVVSAAALASASVASGRPFPLLFQLLFMLLLQLLLLLVLVEFIDFLEGTITNLWTGHERFDGNGIGGGQYVFIEPRKIIDINRSGFVDPFF